jgi:hypothetical protein
MDGNNQDRDVPIEVRQIKYLNNIVEQSAELPEGANCLANRGVVA